MSNAGQAALAIVGTIVGFAVGGPAGAAYGFQLGLAVGTLVSPTQLPGTFGPRLQDKRTTNVELGTPITELFGRDVVTGTIIWLGEVIETSMTDDVGGKGAPEGSNTTYSYKQSIAIGLCRGPQAGVRRIWENGKLVYDIRIIAGESPDDFLLRIAANEAYASGFTLYEGDETQLADPTIEEKEGVGNVPAYRGLAYIVYIERALRDDQALRHPSFKFELDASVTSGGESYIIPGVLFVTNVPGGQTDPYLLRALAFNALGAPDVIQFEDTEEGFSTVDAVDVCGKGSRVFAIGNLSQTQYWARFSNDGGLTFAPVTVGGQFGTPPTDVQPFSCDMSADNYLIVCSGQRLPTNVEALVYTTADDAQVWGNCSTLGVEFDFRFGRVKYIEPANIWLCGGFRGIAKSLDGITWYQPLSGGIGARDFVYGAVTTIAAVTSSSIYASTDDGETWSLAYNGGFEHRGLAFCNFTWCRYDAGIFGVIDGGFSVATSVAGPWSALAAPAGWDIRDLISDGQKFIAVGSNAIGSGNTLIGVSTDGVNWSVASQDHLALARIVRAKNRWTSL